jgi:hypothetical protein
MAGRQIISYIAVPKQAFKNSFMMFGTWVKQQDF